LEQERDALNARFAEKRYGGARLEQEEVLAHLADVIAPAIGRVHEILPERTRGTLVALFDVSLELFAASLLGSTARHPFVSQLWRDVLPLAARIVAREPQRLAGCLSNAVHNVASQPETRPAEWLDRMQRLAPGCDNASQLLECGKIVAWQAGLVQYRAAALAALHQLPAPLSAATLGTTWEEPADAWSRVVDRLAGDPWRIVASAAEGEDHTEPVVRLVRVAGAFRGFGGLMRRPPTVSCQASQLLVTDGESQWLLLADAYGTLFHRVTDANEQRRATGSETATIDPDGHVRWGAQRAHLPQLAGSTSSACDGATLAVTLATSHHVFLIACTRSAA
jgi:hypothetical protein